MRDKAIVKAEMRELEGHMNVLRGQYAELLREHNDIELAEASAKIPFPVGTVLTRYDRWKNKTHRAIYQGVRRGTYGIEDYGINIKKDGKNGSDIRITWTDGWKPESPQS